MGYLDKMTAMKYPMDIAFKHSENFLEGHGYDFG